MPLVERTLRTFILAAAGLVVLAAAGLVWTAQRRLLSEAELSGAPCPRITHAEALRLRLNFPATSVEQRNPVNGILVSTLNTRKRCSQVLGRASCGLDGRGYTRVQSRGELAYFVLGEGESAFLDVRAEAVRCVLAPGDAVAARFP